RAPGGAQFHFIGLAVARSSFLRSPTSDEPEEPRPRPMRAGDLDRYGRERRKGLAPIFKAAVDDGHHMRPAAPFPHKAHAWLTLGDCGTMMRPWLSKASVSFANRRSTAIGRPPNAIS